MKLRKILHPKKIEEYKFQKYRDFVGTLLAQNQFKISDVSKILSCKYRSELKLTLFKILYGG